MHRLVLLLVLVAVAGLEAQTDPVRAVRELGRQERPALFAQIVPSLSHARVEVRREAATAAGQAFAAVPRLAAAPPPPELATATRALLTRLRMEPDAVTKGIVAEALGRLPHRLPAALREIEQALRVQLTDAHPAAVAGAAKGLDTLIRATTKVQAPEAATIAQLRAAAVTGSDPSDADLALVRRLAWLALTAAGPLDAATIERGYDDPDLQVRRRVVLASVPATMNEAQRRTLFTRALQDPAFQVRVEAVRAYGRTLMASDCGPLTAAVDDANVHVSLAALDALGTGCTASVPRLIALTEQRPAPDSPSPLAASWHKPAHALVALARVAREEATPRLAAFAESPDWQVRVYAARAAAALAAAARLERLAADAHDNVRHAALEGLRRVRGHAADAIYIAALERRDYQLVLLAAQALEGSSNQATAVPALLKAFARITAERRDTSRDTRMAILTRLRELGTGAEVASLRCAMDADPVIAAECGGTVVPPPYTPPPARVLPGRARLTMASGGTLELRLFGDEAPATVARFVELARKGYYNGLSFWRVAPGQWLQGGSPGANEYAGADPFMRDELGMRSHTRGTLGISTRGRHTGDAQIFVNLLDNPRIDHEFTVFAEITAGMDVADAVLEGDVVKSIVILDL
jgi:cyclophilin family peptidyl-prolyl cis-trans isomerase/HEAT repeat protein